MQRLVTAAEMQTIDRRAAADWGIAGPVLMENAGRAAADAIEHRFAPLCGRRFLIVCGKGNNGGDGFVIARHLANRGALPLCLLLGRTSELKGDARANADILLKSGLPLRDVASAEELGPLLSGAGLSGTVLVDAIFGTGFSGAPQGLAAAAIRLLNDSGLPTVSIDIPSGVNADSGAVAAEAVNACLTVTMCLPKIGLYLYPGRAHSGCIEVADIGIPQHLLTEGATTFLADDAFVRNHVPPRRPDGHKGTFGTCLVIAGSSGFSGAACLTAMAAVRSGAGLVRLAHPASLSNVVESAVLEAVKHPLPETGAGTLSRAALDPLLELTESADSVAIGPGISTHPETRELVAALLSGIDRPIVLDADGINCLTLDVLHSSLTSRNSPLVMTPHPGELARLIGSTPNEVNADRVNTALSFSRRHGAVLLLKGAPTVIAEPQGTLFLNPTGNSGLGSGGTGDVLTGLIAGLIAQKAKPLDATICAAFLHGRAADLAAADLTQYCVCASDVLNYLPRAFRSVLGC
ncbi:MAG: NAD(P)H-hydrate dehydratase [candidate division WOR-3 bacterium]